MNGTVRICKHNIYMYVDVFAKVFIVLGVSQQVQWGDLVVKYSDMLNCEHNSTFYVHTLY